MKLGYFTMPLHPPGRDYLETLTEDREAIVLADALGYTEAYVGEHVTDTAETITDCSVFLASLAHITSNITLCTGTVNLPNNHPGQVAAKIAMLDTILEGRFMFGISPGGLPSDWELLGTLDLDRRAMFLESIEHILALWAADGPISRDGAFWKLSTLKTQLAEIGQGLMVKPFQKPHPPIVVTAVEPFSKGVSAAAARGWKVVSANFLLPQWVRSHWQMIETGCAEAGLTPDPAEWRVAKTVFVADDPEVARAYGHGPEGPYWFYYQQLGTKLVRAGRANIFKPDASMADDEVTTDYLVDRLVITGTVDEVVEQLLAFREETGDFGTLVYCGMDWVDEALGRRSLELMAREVMPALNRALGSRDA